MLNRLKQHKLELGIILANLGIQFSVITKELFPFITLDLTNIVFFASLLLTANFSNVLSLKIMKFSKIMVAILIYNLYVLLMAYNAGVGMFTQIKGMIYTLYVIAFIFCLMTNDRKIDGEYFTKVTWVTTGIYSCFLFYLSSVQESIQGGTFTYLVGGADRLTLSVIAFIHLCTALAVNNKGIIEKIIKYIFFIIAFYDMMSCSRRGLMVAYIIIIIYRAFMQVGILKVSKKNITNIIVNCLFFVTIVYLASTIINNFFNMFFYYIERLSLGVNTYFGNTENGVDAAASSRNLILNTVPKEYWNSDFKIFIFGNGYCTQQLDVPYLQAFTDLGLIGGIFYFVIACIYPVMQLLSKKSNHEIPLIDYLTIMTITYNLYSGVPYGNYKFIALILLAFISRNDLSDVRVVESEFKNERFVEN